MKDLRIIDRDELMGTIRELIDLLAEEGTQAAQNGQHQTCINKMFAAGEVERLWEEIRANTKHSPDPTGVVLPEAMAVVRAVAHEMAMDKEVGALIANAYCDYLEMEKTM